MLLHLPRVLTATHLKSIEDIFNQSEFVDGQSSAGVIARAVKNNLEFDTNQRSYHLLNELVMGQLTQHGKYQRSAFAIKVSSPMYIKYGVGMGYGDHIDNPVMGKEFPYRCDIAITVFLNEPQAYGGGELVVTTEFGEQAIKMAAGDAVMYPASSLHRVNPVTEGERLVAVIWLQSMVRSPQHREILTNLSSVRDELMQNNSQAAKKIDQSYVNLMRMWAEF